MSTTKKVLLTVLATMAFAASAFAAVPSGNNPGINGEKVPDWRRRNYTQPLPGSGAAINIPRVTDWRRRNTDWRRRNYTEPLPGSGAAINIPHVTTYELRYGGNEEAVALTKKYKPNAVFLNRGE